MDGRADGAGGMKLEEHMPGHWQNFPAGLRLLVVDDDPLCLKVVEQMLRKCSYEGERGPSHSSQDHQCCKD